MLKKIIYALLSFIIACTPKINQQEATILENKTTTMHENQIDSLANRYLDVGRFSGTIVVSENGAVVFNKSYGLADYSNVKNFTDSTAFKIGHLSELFTKAIVEDLISKNKIKAEEQIKNYIPQIEKEFTVEELLNHTSGLQTISQIQEANENMPYSTLEYVALSNSENQNVASELDYNILGLLIEKVTEKSFDEVLEDYAQKWNLESTYFHKTDTTHLAIGYLFFNYGNQGLKLSPAPKYQNSTAFSSRGIKSTALDILKFTKQFPNKNFDTEGYLMNDGFSYSLKKDDSKDRTVLILSNRKHPVAREMSESIEKILDEEEYELPLPRREIAIDVNLLKEYEGTYSLNENMSLTFVAEKDSLFFLMGENKIRLIPQSENQFFMLESDASTRFERDENGKVTKAILMDGFLEGNTIMKVME
ncbi:serine hydrolase [Bernardetia sp.]|uniref:serine hydrolase n=1 Tax=Bernardetia sp. TaxID=1937974 RepID=UPI0025BA7FE6|nr:serine hydrolase [Bernardetia sp.]